jgi:hypothetical protein
MIAHRRKPAHLTPVWVLSHGKKEKNDTTHVRPGILIIIILFFWMDFFRFKNFSNSGLKIFIRILQHCTPVAVIASCHATNFVRLEAVQNLPLCDTTNVLTERVVVALCGTAQPQIEIQVVGVDMKLQTIAHQFVRIDSANDTIERLYIHSSINQECARTASQNKFH